MDIVSMSDRRVALYVLLKCKLQLKQMASFTDYISKSNFTVTSGWTGGKTYISAHDCDDAKIDLRGTHALDLVGIKTTDFIVLSEEQYKDYKFVSGLVNE
jgi:hypothetical protein